MEKFNGLVISNGQTASFNKIVGKRTAEAGFKEAKIIVDGEFVPGIGGGVCQASTTIFNALLLSGLKIETSHNHSLPISYVPIGRDAMVSSCADLVFTNNTGGNLYFETGTTRNTAWIKIYGNKTSVQYKPRTTVTEMPLKDDECDPARKSTTYLDAYRDGRLVHTKLIRKSSYRSTKGTPPEPEPEIQNP
jgi:vancomycin resistance protein YoaR